MKSFEPSLTSVLKITTDSNHGVFKQGFLTQVYQRVTFQSKNAPRATVYWKKAFKATIYKRSPQNKLNLSILFNVLGPNKCIWRATCDPRV